MGLYSCHGQAGNQVTIHLNTLDRVDIDHSLIHPLFFLLLTTPPPPPCFPTSLPPLSISHSHPIFPQPCTLSPSPSRSLTSTLTPSLLPPPSQEFGYSDLGELQFEEDLCLDVSSQRPGAHVQILNCHGLGGNQKWAYNNKVRCLALLCTVHIC